MTPIGTNRIEFITEVGNVEIFILDGGYVFEFISGWNNGLHCDESFVSFDKCYTYIKSKMKDWKLEQKNG